MTLTLIFDKCALRDFQIDGVSQDNVSEVWIHGTPEVSEYWVKYVCLDTKSARNGSGSNLGKDGKEEKLESEKIS